MAEKKDDKPNWFQSHFGIVSNVTEYKYAPAHAPDYGELDWRSMQFDPNHSKNASRFYHSRVLLDAQNAYAGLVEDNDRKNRHGAAWGNVQWGYHWLVLIKEVRDPQIKDVGAELKHARELYKKQLDLDGKRVKEKQNQSEDLANAKLRLEEVTRKWEMLKPEKYPVNFDGHRD